MMSFRTALAGAALAAAAFCTTTPAAQASVAVSSKPFFISYDINLPNYAVQDILMFEQGAPNPNPNGYGITNSSPPPGFAASVGSTTLTDPFQKTDPIVATFLVGVTSGLPGDAPGQEHLVLFTNDAWASSATSIAWGTLFPNTDEDTLINDVTTGVYSSDNTVWQQAFSDLFGFAGGDAVSGTNGSIAFAPGDHFTAIAFSTGQIIGGGNVFTTLAGGVPETGTWVLMLIGLGGLGGALRARRRHRFATA